MAVTVKVTETYDMKTTKDKLGLIGIHTPQLTLLRKLYPGLLKNHKFIRFVKCDVVGASASALPADPLQIGVSSGFVAPEDMFNPILYTAVTNESYDTLVARVRNLTAVSPLNSVDAGDFATASWSTADVNFKAYYALLSENGKFRKVMPQSGFMIKNLVPLAHTVISTFGNVGNIGNTTALAGDGENEVNVPDVDVPELDGSWGVAEGQEIFYRGRSVRMPKFPIHIGSEQPEGVPYPNVPKTMVALLCLPPAKLNEFYYRMRVTWTVRFEQVCSTLESGVAGVFTDVGGSSYAKSYNFSNSKIEMPENTDMVDGQDVEINKIMES